MKNYSRCITGGSNGDEDDSEAIPNSDRAPEQELLSPELGFLVAAALRCVSGEKLRCSSIFRSVANI